MKNNWFHKTSRHLLTVLITLIISGIGYYITLPAINPHAMEFWVALVLVSILFAVVDLLICKRKPERIVFHSNGKTQFRPFRDVATAVPVICIAAAVVCTALGSLSSLTIFQSGNLSKMIEVKPADITEYDVGIDDVPLMDKDTATLLSQRKMGGLTDLVSQYSVGVNTQINLSGTPVRVAPLNYNGFFKWFGNRKSGIVGYITVDMISQKTELVRTERGMKYSDSAYFNDKLLRHLRFAAPTKILGDSVFELDEQGNPYWVTAYYKFRAGWFGGKDVAGVLLTDSLHRRGAGLPNRTSSRVGR